MTEAIVPYREETALQAKYVCVACFACSASTAMNCASCGSQMRALAEPEVSEFVMAEATRRVSAIMKRQGIHAAIIGVPLMVYLLTTNVGTTVSYGAPLAVLFLVAAVHPYIFKKDSRIARKYRRPPRDLAEALDVLGTRIQ